MLGVAAVDYAIIARVTTIAQPAKPIATANTVGSGSV
jgi:hypothetical protein